MYLDIPFSVLGARLIEGVDYRLFPVALVNGSMCGIRCYSARSSDLFNGANDDGSQ